MNQPAHPFDADLDGPAAKGPVGRPLPASRPLALRDAMILVGIAAVLVRVALPAGPVVAVVLAVVALAAAAAGGIGLWLRGRSARSEPMLRVVAAAVERGLPVEPGIEACAALCGGALGARGRAVVRLMERGVPMGEAFARVPGSFPSAGLVYLRMGWDGPALAEALRGVIRRRAEWQPLRSMMGSRLAYLSATLLAMQLMIVYMFSWFVPKLRAISMDFGVDLPTISQRVFLLGDHPAFGPMMAGLILLELFALPTLCLIALEPMEWRIGPLDWLLRKRHGATVLRALAVEVGLERPMPDALERIARAHPSGTVRRRLRRARVRVERGRPWARSLAAVGLIRPSDAAVLDAAERAGNLDWALRDLADGLDRRSAFRLIAWGHLLYPVAVVALAVPVVAFVLAYFLPLVTLIRALAA